MESIWTKTTKHPSFPALDTDCRVDVAIVGGGLTGLLTAYYLKNSGLSVVILEQDHIGQGKTGHTTAKITSQHGLIYTKLSQQLGRERARQYAATQQKAVCSYRQIIHQEQIDCDFSNRFSYLYSTQNTDLLKRETENALKLGLPASFTMETELPFSIAGAMKFDNQAQFHPLQFLYALAEHLTSNGQSSVPVAEPPMTRKQPVTEPSMIRAQSQPEPQLSSTHQTGAVHRSQSEQQPQCQASDPKQQTACQRTCRIYEHSQVTKIKDHTLSVQSPHGSHFIKAEHILLTSGYPIKDIPGFYFMRQHQEISYLIALDHAQSVEGMYYCCDQSGYTFRSYDGLLLFGGLGHRTGKLQPGDAYRRLWNTSRQWYPRAACVAHWSNEDAMPHDSVPFIGPFSLWMPHVYVATGYQKWGMTGAMVAATILSGEVLGRADESYDIYRPQRMSLAGLGPFFTDLGHSVLHLALQKPFAPKEKQKAIDKGFGPTCSHLGCTLSWNPSDRTWDCPCHGSRYTEAGERIAGPACECMSGIREH